LAIDSAKSRLKRTFGAEFRTSIDARHIPAAIAVSITPTPNSQSQNSSRPPVSIAFCVDADSDVTHKAAQVTGRKCGSKNAAPVTNKIEA
jgi:hypothetical protein